MVTPAGDLSLTGMIIAVGAIFAVGFAMVMWKALASEFATRRAWHETGKATPNKSHQAHSRGERRFPIEAKNRVLSGMVSTSVAKGSRPLDRISRAPRF